MRITQVSYLDSKYTVYGNERLNYSVPNVNKLKCIVVIFGKQCHKSNVELLT